MTTENVEDKMRIAAFKIDMASPEQILSWSHGEVKVPETINYRTLKPERDGLLCERIFGPIKDWECHCGKYKKIRYKGKICDRCGVEVTRASVRRERMGHIALAAPVSHIWYFKGRGDINGYPFSPMCILLDIDPQILESVLYFSKYIVIEPGETPLVKTQILSEKEYRDYREKYEDDFQAGMGAEAVKKLLQDVDLEALSKQLHAELKESSGRRKVWLVTRLKVVDAFRLSGNKPEWMVIDVLPVIPPELRPMVQLDGGRFATSDLNEHYRRVINRNNRLKRLFQLDAPDVIVRNEKRMLQEAVDALIDNGCRGRAVTGANNRALKSLSDLLKGEQGRFRLNLLGKRVDYSGRSVIVVGPELKIYQCGVPKEMAVELFRPFIMKKLVSDGLANNIKSAKKMVDKGVTEVWDALDEVIKDHPVMLNRAPTLHRLGIQAFEPVLVDGRALKLHPLNCAAFNADFDGDQMAIHVPLSPEAQAEARILMLSANNLLRPQDGGLVTVPTQDIVLGAYYLTLDRMGKAEKGAETIWCEDAGDTDLKSKTVVNSDDFLEANDSIYYWGGKWARKAIYKPLHYYASEEEALMAYNDHVIGIHCPIGVRRSLTVDGVTHSAVVEATPGRIIFNQDIPQDLGFVDRSDPDHVCDYEINFTCGKKQLGQIVDRTINKHGFTVAAEVLDAIKATGCKYSTKAAITVSIADITIPPQKYEMLADSERKVLEIEDQYKMGSMTAHERYEQVVQVWEKTTSDVSNALQRYLDYYNPIFMMTNSGACGSIKQICQLAGMCGLIANTDGRTIEIPIKSNYREGLTALEYFISSRDARKGLVDTAMRIADSGYLTRRMVDVSQDVIIREEDCHVTHGIKVSEISENGQVIEKFSDRIRGRYLVGDVVDADTGKVLLSNTKMMDESDAKLLETRKWIQANYREGDRCAFDPVVEEHPTVMIRTVLTCKAHSGVCARCYGTNLATRRLVERGEPVGIIAAQSIGELAYTLHSSNNSMQSIYRLKELFEAYDPKRMATLSEISGTVKFEGAVEDGPLYILIIAPDGYTRFYAVPHTGILVKDGDVIEAGHQLTYGALNLHDVLRIRGADAVYNYLIQEVLRVYRQQGVDINDKHIEIIVRQMMRKVRLEDAGDTKLLDGSMVDVLELDDANEEIDRRNAAGERQENGKPLRHAVGIRLLMGITEASLATDSFLSAASFQETTKILTEAAIKGKSDHLVGLKENVIIGKLIPAGTGLLAYQQSEKVESERKTVDGHVPTQVSEKHVSLGDYMMESVRDSDRSIMFYTKIAGVTFDNVGANTQNRQRIISELCRKGELRAGTELTLKRDPQNPYDTNAVAVIAPDGRQLGFLPREVAGRVSPDIDAGAHYTAFVETITGGDADSLYGVNIKCVRQ